MSRFMRGDRAAFLALTVERKRLEALLPKGRPSRSPATLWISGEGLRLQRPQASAPLRI